jgi:hypothetical protein
MITHPVSVLLLAVALSASASVPLFAASKNDLPIAFSVRTLTASSNGDMKVNRGMDRGDVSYALKYKSREVLSPDVWVYSGFHADVDPANDQGAGTVVITFANDKVADIQLVNKPAVALIAASLRLGSPARNIASK